MVFQIRSFASICFAFSGDFQELQDIAKNPSEFLEKKQLVVCISTFRTWNEYKTP